MNHMYFTIVFVICTVVLLAALFVTNRAETFAVASSPSDDDMDISIVSNVMDVFSVTLNRMPSTKELRKYHDRVKTGLDYNGLKLILEGSSEYASMIRMQSNVYGGELPKMTERQLEFIVGNIYQTVFGHLFDDSEREYYIRKYGEFNHDDDRLKQFMISVRTFEDAPPPSMGYNLFADTPTMKPRIPPLSELASATGYSVPVPPSLNGTRTIEVSTASYTGAVIDGTMKSNVALLISFANDISVINDAATKERFIKDVRVGVAQQLGFVDPSSDALHLFRVQLTPNDIVSGSIKALVRIALPVTPDASFIDGIANMISSGPVFQPIAGRWGAIQYVAPQVIAPPTQIPAQAPTQMFTSPTQAPMQIPTQAPIQILTQAPMQIPTQAPMQILTQAPTQAPTQSPMQIPSQAPTQAPMQIPAQIPAQAPMQIPSPSTVLV